LVLATHTHAHKINLTGVDTVVMMHNDNFDHRHMDKSVAAGDGLGSISYTKSSVMGTHIVMETAKHLGVKRFVYLSSDEVYGTNVEEQHTQVARVCVKERVCVRVRRCVAVRARS
jgi:nucleoside-diphosphate-sugar epimerase